MDKEGSTLWTMLVFKNAIDEIKEIASKKK